MDWTDLTNRFVGPILRHYLAALFVVLTAHGFTFDAALEGDLTKAALAVLPIIILSIWQKFQAAKVVQAALALPAGASIHQAISKAKEF